MMSRSGKCWTYPELLNSNSPRPLPAKRARLKTSLVNLGANYTASNVQDLVNGKETTASVGSAIESKQGSTIKSVKFKNGLPILGNKRTQRIKTLSAKKRSTNPLLNSRVVRVSQVGPKRPNVKEKQTVRCLRSTLRSKWELTVNKKLVPKNLEIRVYKRTLRRSGAIKRRPKYSKRLVNENSVDENDSSDRPDHVEDKVAAQDLNSTSSSPTDCIEKTASASTEINADIDSQKEPIVGVGRSVQNEDSQISTECLENDTNRIENLAESSADEDFAVKDKEDRSEKIFNPLNTLSSEIPETCKTEKRYKCQICSEGCSCMTEVLVHISAHSIQKRLKCQYCSQKFPQTETLKAHVESIHRGVIWYRNGCCWPKDFENI